MFRAARLMIDTPVPSCYIRNMKWTESETALLAELLLQLGAQGRAVAAIDGNAAAGKSTLAARIAAFFAPQYSVNVFHMDDFFLPGALRTPERLAEPGGNVHYERFQDEVLARKDAAMLARFESIWIPMENAYFSAFRIPEQCDFVLHAEDMNEIPI